MSELTDFELSVRLTEFIPSDRKMDVQTQYWQEGDLTIFAMKIPIRREYKGYDMARLLAEIQVPKFMLEGDPETNHILGTEIQKAFDVVHELEKIL